LLSYDYIFTDITNTRSTHTSESSGVSWAGQVANVKAENKAKLLQLKVTAN